jgi:hypothetical protein
MRYCIASSTTSRLKDQHNKVSLANPRHEYTLS